MGPIGKGLPPETSSRCTHRRCSRLRFPPHSGQKIRKYNYLYRVQMISSDYLRELRTPYWGGSRPRFPHNSLKDEVPARDFLHTQGGRA
eukprot:2973445-Pyramimonas_sp.AAC.1